MYAYYLAQKAMSRRKFQRFRRRKPDLATTRIDNDSDENIKDSDGDIDYDEMPALAPANRQQCKEVEIRHSSDSESEDDPLRLMFVR